MLSSKAYKTKQKDFCVNFENGCEFTLIKPCGNCDENVINVFQPITVEVLFFLANQVQSPCEC